MATNIVTIDIKNMPEALAELRSELSSILRDEAESDCNPAVARRLREIAAAFEAGQSVQ